MYFFKGAVEQVENAPNIVPRRKTVFAAEDIAVKRSDTAVRSGQFLDEATKRYAPYSEEN
ncbi:TPA: hypothetical protein EYP13_03070 [Candidatus Micrarchaeota archaeon]|nr:hypothetical protein [Candidatus Micrarchaeota archaeon]